MPLPRLKRHDNGRLLACPLPANVIHAGASQSVMRAKAAMQLGGNIGDTRMMDDGTKENKKRGAIQGQVIHSSPHYSFMKTNRKGAPRIATYLRAYTITHKHSLPFRNPLFNAITRTHNGKRKDARLVDWPRTLNLIPVHGSQLVMRVKQFGHL